LAADLKLLHYPSSYYIKRYSWAEVGKVTLKSNDDEALNDEFILKSNGDEALNDGFP
jgi:hypothetical protein